MKNMKKLVSLILAVCLMASLAIGASATEPTTVDVSGGTGTSSVSLSSTSDGTLDGDPAATKMNVAIPTILPIAVGTDGTVTTATDIRITNNSFGAVKVDNVKVEAGTGWKLTAFGSKDSLAKVKVDSNMIGFRPVSYTHLDVYKRQMWYTHILAKVWFSFLRGCIYMPESLIDGGSLMPA